MNKIKYQFLLLMLTLTGCFSFAQQIIWPDFVKASGAYIDTIVKNYSDENAFPFDLETITFTAKIPIRVHVIKSINGEAGVVPSNIYTSIDTTNSFFKNIGIQFFIDTINYINDYNYSYIRYNTKRKELLTMHTKSNAINLFLADSIRMDTNRSYGFTYFPDAPDSNYIFLEKGYITGLYLTTMMGHFFGLLSTHDMTGGTELASETNCSTSGDYLCDTYADPNLAGQVNSICNYTGAAVDPNGDYYVPTAANIMSNTLDECKCKFTLLQYRRMYYYYLKYRQYLAY